MTMLKRLLSTMALLVLAACGGTGGDGGSPYGGPVPGGGGDGGTGGGGTAVSDLVIVLSADTISNSGTETVIATVTALDANRNAIKDVAVALSANNDAIVTLTSGSVTDDSGRIQANIGIGSNRENRVIVLTASSGGLSATANLTVVTGAPPKPTASDISLSLSAPSIPNSGSVTVLATVTAVDANRNTISGIPVTIRVDSDATVLVSGSATDSSGSVTGAIGIGANRANRPIKVTAVSGSLTRETVLQVTGTRLTGTALPAVLEPSAAGKVQYKVTDSSNAPIAAFDILVVGPGGVQTAAKTDSNGSYEYAYTAPSTAGSLDIRASSGGVDLVTNVIVQSGPGTIPPVPAGSVRSASVRANPSVVAINAAGFTGNRAEVRALFVGDNNQPIKNIRVRFDLDSDLNSIGGSFASGTTVIYSDVNGIALSSYIPAARFSPTDGVTVRACWDYDDFAAGTCPNSAKTTLTVISDPLSVTIGTDNLVDVSEPLVYTQRFVVQVNDSSGLAKADAQISPLLDLTSYSQGDWYWDDSVTTDKRWRQNVTAGQCENEDVNRNGVLEVYSSGEVEDANTNRQLDPRKADAVVSFDGPSRTDSAGRIVLRLTYPRNVGSWVAYKLTVAATGVAGTEGRASFSGTLIVPIDDVKNEADPPFIDSPYGASDGLPRIVVTTPDGRASASLCTR